jgi:hypothetical protein
LKISQETILDFRAYEDKMMWHRKKKTKQRRKTGNNPTGNLTLTSKRISKNRKETRILLKNCNRAIIHGRKSAG